MKKTKKIKKAQITLYVVVAILIVLIGATSYLIYTNIKAKRISQEEILYTKDHLKNCVENALSNYGLLLIAKQGGYYILPNESINFLEEKTAFYLKENKSLVPTKRSVELQIVKWIKDNTKQCYNIATYKILKIMPAEKVDVYLRNNRTEIALEGIVIKKEKDVASLNVDFVINIDITKYINISENIVNEFAGTNPYVCIECVDFIGVKNNVNISIVSVTKYVYKVPHVWFLINADEKLNNKSFVWRFVTELNQTQT